MEELARAEGGRARQESPREGGRPRQVRDRLGPRPRLKRDVLGGVLYVTVAVCGGRWQMCVIKVSVVCGLACGRMRAWLFFVYREARCALTSLNVRELVRAGQFYGKFLYVLRTSK